MTPAEAISLPTADCYVVIDVLRATTTMAVLFSRGLRGLRVVETITAGRERARDTKAILLGEEGGLKPAGFDYGNSPAEAATLELKGREAIHVTSNGTRAICAVAGRGVAVAGALVNLSAVSAFAGSFDRLMLVCAGNHSATSFSLEDFAVAAAYVRQLLVTAPEATLGDAARLANQLSTPDSFIGQSEHAAALRRLGFENDIELACRRDSWASVPVVRAWGEGWATLGTPPEKG